MDLHFNAIFQFCKCVIPDSLTLSMLALVHLLEDLDSLSEGDAAPL